MKSKDSWKKVRLAEVAEINPTRPRTLSSLPDDHLVTFVPMPAVNQRLGTIDHAETRPFLSVRKGFTYFAEGDVIFAKITPCMQNGKSAIARGLENGLGFGSTEFHVIRAELRRVIPEWIWFFVRQQSFRDEGVRHFRGGVGQQRVPRDYLANAEIPLPHVDQQRRVVERINECMLRLEEIESLRQESLAEADHLTTSLYAAITDGTECQRKKVGEIIVRTRNGRSIRQDNENSTGFVLSLTAVHDVSLDLKACKPIVLPENVAKQYRISDGDVFVSRSNTRELVGLASVATESPTVRLIYPDLLIKLEVNRSEVFPRFLAYALRMPDARKQIQERAVGTSQSMVKVSGERLKDVEIPIPSLRDQECLLETFDELHDLSAGLVAEMKSPDLGLLRESILRKAFAGEL